MKYLRNNCGYSLLEALLVIALIGIILTPICSFFISSLKTYHRTDDQLELQYQVQVGMNELIDKVLNTGGIKNISFYNNAENKVSKVVFDNSISGDEKQQSIVIEQKMDGLFFGYNNSATVVFANYISHLILKPLPEEWSYQDCKGIEITLITKKNNSELSITNQIFFRN